MKLLRSQSRRNRKYPIESAHDARQCSKALTVCQANHLPVDSFDQKFMTLYIESIRLFSSIVTPDSDYRRRSIEINPTVNEWEDKRSFLIDRSSNEKLVCRTVKSAVDSAVSDVDIRVIDDAPDDPPLAERETYTHEFNLIVDDRKEEISVGSLANDSESPDTTVTSRVRLAIEAIEQQCRS